MKIYYTTITGNIERFLRKSEFSAEKISKETRATEPFILVTNTIGFGRPPGNVQRFAARNSDYLVGVAASGNRNWGAMYAKAADYISDQYNVPVLLKFELSGTDEDIDIFTERVWLIGDEYESHRIK